MQLNTILQEAVKKRATDIFVTSAVAPAFRINSEIVPSESKALSTEDFETLVKDLYSNNAKRSMKKLSETGDDDFSFSMQGIGRFRVNVSMQKGEIGIIIRVLPTFLPKYEDINIPESIMKIALQKNGMVLVTGAVGSGKTTTLACIIDKINSERAKHVITIEDPIEFIHQNKKSIITQREIGLDTEDYESGLKVALRQAPDVILAGEMRDAKTMEVAMSAAETGQLFFSTLHTASAVGAVDRIINSFNANEQPQVRFQLSMILRAIISQKLIPSVNGELKPAFEVLVTTPAVRHMIREGKTHQIYSTIFSSRQMGMQTMDSSIFSLYTEGKISSENAIFYSTYPEEMACKVGETEIT